MAPYGIVVARFRPDKSAYWLPRSGQLTAAKLPCPPFWALRFDLDDGDGDKNHNTPGLLCVVSPFPSSLALPDSCFTIGPKVAVDTGECSTDNGPDGAQLTANPAIKCFADDLHHPLYLHTAPALSILGADRIPMKVMYHEVDPHDFSRFRAAARVNNEALFDAWTERRKAVAAERLLRLPAPLDADRVELDLFSGGNRDPTYMFSELNNPQAYCFDFVDSDVVPFCDQSSKVYNQLFVYHQICKDYRWRGVERAIQEVRAVRTQNDREHRGFVEPAQHDQYDAEVAAQRNVQDLLEHESTYKQQLAGCSALVAIGFSDVHRVSGSAPSNNLKTLSNIVFPTGTRKSCDGAASINGRIGINSGPDRGGDRGCGNGEEPGPDGGGQKAGAAQPNHGGDAEPALYLLAFASPRLPWRFPRVPLPNNPRVIVLDVFGVILDREAAIRDALEPWLPVARRRPRDTAEAVKMYMELEALTLCSRQVRATSLPAIVHSVLHDLASKLDLARSSRCAFLSDAMSCILAPPPHEDAGMALSRLARRGYTIVGLTPSTPSVFNALHPTLLRGVHFFPVSIPLHAHVPSTFFRQLRRWCQRTVLPLPMRRTRTRSLAPADVLVVSGSMGRILCHAVAGAHPTVLLRRTGGIECNVDFVVGTRDSNPCPSAVAGSLVDLCDMLHI